MIHILFFGKVWDIKKHFSGPCEEVTEKKKKKPTDQQTTVFREVLPNTSPEMHTVEC